MKRGGSTSFLLPLTDGMVQVECKTFAFTFMSFSTTSTWLVVVMTLDRCVAVMKPLYQPKW